MKNLWSFFKKKVEIKPGESKGFQIELPKDRAIKEILLNYDDEYGNKYETRMVLNFKDKKIVSQDYKMVKQVKFIPEKDRPKLVIDEKELEDMLENYYDD